MGVAGDAPGQYSRWVDPAPLEVERPRLPWWSMLPRKLLLAASPIILLAFATVGVAPLADAGRVLRGLLPACHNASVQRVDGQSDGQRSVKKIFFCCLFVLVRGGAPPGTRTPNPLIPGPLFRLVADRCDDLELPGSRMLDVCGRLVLSGCH